MKFFYVYLVLLLALGVAAILFLIYAICKDQQGTRALLPWTFLITFVTSLLIIFWIVIYISCFYHHEEVTVQNMNMDEDESSEDGQRKKYVQ